MSTFPTRKRTGSEEEVFNGNGSATAGRSKVNLFAEFQKAAEAGNVSAYGGAAMSESQLRAAAAAKGAATKAAKAAAKAEAAAKAKEKRAATKAATAAATASGGAGAAAGAGRGGNNRNNTRNKRTNDKEEKELDSLTALIQTWVIAKKDPGYIGRLFGALKTKPDIVKAHVTATQAALLTKRSFVERLETKFTVPNV